MKKLIQTIILLGASCVCAQTNGLTFQWHGQTMGVEFEVTNLAASVKNAIRDDVAYALSLIPSTNVTFEALTPVSSGYGKYAGFARFSSARIDYCTGVLCFYKTVGNMVCWEIDTDTSTTYLAAIAVTNQYATAVNAFTNYFYQFTEGKIDTSKMTLAEKKALVWNPPFMQRLEADYRDTLEEILSEIVPAVPAPLGACPFPSILAFTVEIDFPEEWNPPLLCCEVKFWGEYKSTFLFCYVDGKWRFSPSGP